MPPAKMHDDEVHIDVPLVRRLIASQFPDWTTLPLDPVLSTGTVNAIYRLGHQMAVRLPRVERWAGSLERELLWLPRLAPRLPLAVPEPLAVGRPGEGYPFPWAIYRWLDGESFVPDRVDDFADIARDLARFVAVMRQMDPAGAPPSGRGTQPLAERDAVTRAAIESLPAGMYRKRVFAAWEAAMRAPAWDGCPVWTHGDLLAPNLLIKDGRLHAVIDFGSAGTGDPACDLLPAWGILSGESRRAFRTALDVDDATWARGRGWALSIALLIIPYYPETNPAFVEMAKSIVDEVLADHAQHG
jgi:aminoglycoside phosphotransferase (APT) family kinase protein